MGCRSFFLQFASAGITSLLKGNTRRQFWLVDWQPEVSWLNLFGALFHNKWLAGLQPFVMSKCP